MNRYSQETLRRVEQNDETLKELRMGHFGGVNDDGLYFSRDGNDYSRLGAFIGENTHLTTLNVNVSDVASLSLAQEDFFEGIRRNSSIHMICGFMAVMVTRTDKHNIAVLLLVE